MGRKKKLNNKTDIPQFAIERFARCVFDDIRAFHDSEEGQREFGEWQAAKKATLKLHTTKKRAAMAALVVLSQLFLSSWATGFRFRAYQRTIGKVGLLITGEINK